MDGFLIVGSPICAGTFPYIRPNKVRAAWRGIGLTSMLRGTENGQRIHGVLDGDGVDLVPLGSERTFRVRMLSIPVWRRRFPVSFTTFRGRKAYRRLVEKQQSDFEWLRIQTRYPTFRRTIL